MKKYIPHILFVLLGAAIVVLVITGSSYQKNKKRKLDERITLRKQDKIPYGTWVAWNNLQYLFPKADFFNNRYMPGYWRSISPDKSNQVLIIVTDRFDADRGEMQDLVELVKNGNDVFISARYISAAADKILNCTSSSFDLNIVSVDELSNNMELLLNNPPFDDKVDYNYPGKTFSSYFTEVDSIKTEVLGTDKRHRPNFIHLRAGTGNFYVHLEPLAFSNYFLLHKDNISYYEKVMSLLRPDAEKVVWDEYYLYKREARNKPSKKPGWMSVFMKHPALRAALLTAIGTLLIFVLLEMRRKQRPIPVIKKPKNDSLDFVKTIGRLYYEKGDHHNLCKKMSAYFLEYVRNNFKIPTGSLNEDFINSVHYKSGVEKEEIKRIVYFIQYLEDKKVISSQQLSEFHRNLEAFYSKV